MFDEKPIYSTFFGSMGAAIAMILCATGSAYATAKAGTSIAITATRNPAGVMRTLLPVVMAGIISIYGLILAILIINTISSSYDGYTTYNGFVHFGSGVSVGVTGLAAGYAIGEAGSCGVRAILHEPSYFVAMILILIFAEVLGLYGLIVGLLMITK